jgi:hypothetical protein
MCRTVRPIVQEFIKLVDEVDEMIAKMEIVERELKITFVRDKNTGKWTIAQKV